MIIQKNNNDIPDYLNEQFFKNVVANKIESNNFELTSLDFSMGSNPGENYFSHIYRVQAIYNEKGLDCQKWSFGWCKGKICGAGYF